MVYTQVCILRTYVYIHTPCTKPRIYIPRPLYIPPRHYVYTLRMHYYHNITMQTSFDFSVQLGNINCQLESEKRRSSENWKHHLFSKRRIPFRAACGNQVSEIPCKHPF